MSETLQNTIDWAQSKISYLPLTVGQDLNPARTDANNIMQLFLSPSLGPWAWNRAVESFLTVIGQQDYAVTNLQWGYLEKVTLQPAGTITNVVGNGTTATITCANVFDAKALVTITGLTTTAFNGTFTIITADKLSFTFASTTTVSTVADSGVAVSGKAFEIEDIHNTDPLGISTDYARAGSIAVQVMTPNADTPTNYDITFRLISVPQAIYQITLIFQQSPPKFVTLASTWSPILDSYAYIYNRLFLGEALEPIDAQRAQIEKQRGIMALVGIAEGMELKDKAIFIAQYMNIDAQSAMSMLDVQSGVQARGGQ